jgi:hypothetical protein
VRSLPVPYDIAPLSVVCMWNRSAKTGTTTGGSDEELMAI